MNSKTKKRVLITAGPTYEPIDQVRRLTNMSSGRTGCLLAEGLAAAGYDVRLLRGEGCTHPAPTNKKIQVAAFTTRDSLKELLQEHAAEDWHAVLHVAAIGDFDINALLDKDNQPILAKKISGSTSELKIHLKPAPKLIRNLRGWFPSAVLVGWKYELEGKRDNALNKGWRQLADCDTDACVVNGTAYGQGFGFCTPPAQHEHLPGLEELTGQLAQWLATATPRTTS